jgi:hypothetical protein
VQRLLEAAALLAEALRRVALAVEVEDEDAVAPLGEPVGVRRRDAGLPGAALEVEPSPKGKQ